MLLVIPGVAPLSSSVDEVYVVIQQDPGFGSILYQNDP